MSSSPDPNRSTCAPRFEGAAHMNADTPNPAAALKGDWSYPTQMLFGEG